MPELVENPGVPWRNDLIRKNSCEIPKGPPLLTAIFPESSEEVRHLWQGYIILQYKINMGVSTKKGNPKMDGF